VQSRRGEEPPLHAPPNRPHTQRGPAPGHAGALRTSFCKLARFVITPSPHPHVLLPPSLSIHPNPISLLFPFLLPSLPPACFPSLLLTRSLSDDSPSSSRAASPSSSRAASPSSSRAASASGSHDPNRSSRIDMHQCSSFGSSGGQCTPIYDI